MKPAAFEYHRPQTLGDALALLGRYGYEGKALAGGQSLVPTMNLRLAQPGALVDIAGIGELAGVTVEPDGGVRIGATTRQSDVLAHAGVLAAAPIVAAAMRWVGHEANRNRGTFGGSAAHADPAAEIPAVLVALGAQLEIAGASGTRTVDADDFFLGYFTTAVEEDELLTAVRLPRHDGPWAFDEVARRHGDFALAGAAAVLDAGDDGLVRGCRIVLMAVDDTPWRAREAEAAVVGRRLDAEAAREARALVQAAVEPSSDIHASSAYRAHAAGVLVERALIAAAAREEQS